jgi:hypothetical protein
MRTRIYYNALNAVLPTESLLFEQRITDYRNIVSLFSVLDAAPDLLLPLSGGRDGQPSPLVSHEPSPGQPEKNNIAARYTHETSGFQNVRFQ